jgi:hypothetical protein
MVRICGQESNREYNDFRKTFAAGKTPVQRLFLAFDACAYDLLGLLRSSKFAPHNQRKGL